MKVGFGFDVHRLAEGRKFWLGGIEIPHSKGAEGHSDADVMIHAICDALLGAANLGDIGIHFPDTSIVVPTVRGCKTRTKVSKGAVPFNVPDDDKLRVSGAVEALTAVTVSVATGTPVMTMVLLPAAVRTSV